MEQHEFFLQFDNHRAQTKQTGTSRQRKSQENNGCDQSDFIQVAHQQWTTVLGRLLIIGSDQEPALALTAMDQLAAYLRNLKENDVVVGIFYPPAQEFIRADTEPLMQAFVQIWESIDFLEIFPTTLSPESLLAASVYRFWVGLLQRGIRIALNTGTLADHSLTAATKNSAGQARAAGIGSAQTVLCLPVLSQAALQSALRKGHYYISAGARLSCQMVQSGRAFQMGDVLVSVANDQAELQVTLADQTQAAEQKGTLTLRVILNDTACFDYPVTYAAHYTFPILLRPGYVRLELWEKSRQGGRGLLVLTNPFYIE